MDSSSTWSPGLVALLITLGACGSWPDVLRSTIRSTSSGTLTPSLVVDSPSPSPTTHRRRSPSATGSASTPTKPKPAAHAR